ncbi:MAG: DEAD/DEAH box helicase, partial [Acetobacteraceae bacterium]|nr:DEAD/DEAH box helicase [Acetobacteraceae bacterium]
AGTTAGFETAMAPGDAVIHLDHGLGVLRGVETVTAADVATDCLQLAYAGDTGLLVPAAEMDRVWRYGADADGVALDRLKGEAWPKRRAEIERDMDETAGRLLALMRARQSASAPAMHPDRGAYARLVARFPFVPTADQDEAIAAVETDLASGHPMDRLVCGDVGFGKTEIAIRAAGVAALGGWQVAIVAPTTLLARQHLETFRRRFTGLGVEVAGLSRLTPPADARAVRAGLADGSIGIVIGTQALTGKEVRFRKLGLLVVDEEQRFGVRQKNALRKLGQGVHVLTLTATPIPRTLQTALAGLQDLSVLGTAPARRQPIRTARTPLSSALLAQALRRERRRGGQSFVVCPRVEDLAPMREHLRAAAPELRMVEAHGGLKADELDEAMMRFAYGSVDVLLATNIIEAGLDLPRANTMLIWHPDRFGLAQLHQLRGRVGRGRARGFVYLLTDPDTKLAPAALKRLDAFENASRLGSGFAISARDLDLRGAGDLLGEDQAGHVKLLGLTLYRHLLSRALKAATDETAVEDWSPEIKLEVNAYLPGEYVEDDALRVEIYDRLARVLRLGEQAALDEVRDELEDRFGAPPPQVENLLAVTAIRLRCRRLGIAKLDAGPAGVAINLRPGKQLTPTAEFERKGERWIFARASSDERNRLQTVEEALASLR